MPEKFVNVEMREMYKVQDIVRAFQFQGLYVEHDKSVRYHYPMMEELHKQFLVQTCHITNEEGGLIEKMLMHTGKRFVMLEVSDWIMIAKDKQGGIKIKVLANDDMKKYKETGNRSLFDKDENDGDDSFPHIDPAQIGYTPMYADSPITEEQRAANENIAATYPAEIVDILRCPHCESTGGGFEIDDETQHLICAICQSAVDYNPENSTLKPIDRVPVDENGEPIITAELIDDKEEQDVGKEDGGTIF